MAKIDDAKIIELHKQGLTNVQIAAQLTLDPDTVAAHLAIFGLKSSFRNPIEMVDENTAKCKKCGIVKDVNSFKLHRRGKPNEYRLAYCDECRKAQNNKTLLERNDTVEKYIRNRFKELARRCKREGTICLITEDEFMSQFHKQNGLCFYTNEIMLCKLGNSHDRKILSIDKIIPDRGYVKGNVVFCTRKINTCKNDLSLEEIQRWMPGWYSKIEEFLNEHKKIYSWR